MFRHLLTVDSSAHRLQRRFAEQALSRTSGAALCLHNQVEILRDAEENYPAWLRAIGAAERFVHFENYIFQEDDVGRLFADALMTKARQGVAVRVIHDWLGCCLSTSRSFWRRLAAAGVQVRCFNPPKLDSPIGWVTRDHRKTIAIDGREAFVAGLCVSSRWLGVPRRGIAPWRDTGIRILGPAVADVHAAFGQVWRATGSPLPAAEQPCAHLIPPAGDVALRVVAGTPATAGLLRTDQLVSALARRSLWLTDAYFVGVTPYVQALLAAARDGVDVRLLIPHVSDLPVVRTLSKATLRPLLEGGVRIFQWNGSMLHAKTAVADRRWSRIGSSNLNLASLLGNYELDVAIDSPAIANQMERIYLADLANATEVVLSHDEVARGPGSFGRRRHRTSRSRAGAPGVGSSSVAAAGAIRVAHAVGAAMANRRLLGPAEAGLLFASGSVLLCLALLGAMWPALLALPFAAVAAYVGLALLWRGHRLRVQVRHREVSSTQAHPVARSGAVPDRTLPSRAPMRQDTES